MESGADGTRTDLGLDLEPEPASAPSDLDTLDERDLDAGPASGERESDRPLERGAALGRYLVIDRLGMGGMGVVYAAYDPELDRKVAVKLVRPGRAARRSDEVRARLIREAQAMAKLSHPNVVSVHDVGTVGERVFVAMEYIEGRSLRTWSEQEERWEERLRAMIDAGRGLAAAHAKGLVHRDFKPDNVMIERSGRVVVMDFGLARGEEGDSDSAGSADELPEGLVEHETPLGVVLTQAGSLMGTPAYMAPEQFEGGRGDVRSDQFSYCVSLYELLYGERPFPGKEVHSLISAVVSGTLRPEPRSSIPRWIRRVVLRGLAIDPHERWPSMDALLEALGRDPARRRRPWVWSGGIAATVGVVAAASVGLGRLERQRAELRCAERGQAIEQVWSASRREAVRRSLLATGTPHAEEAVERMEAWLDGWVGTWAEERAAVCRRAEIDGDLEPQTHTRAVACFEEQRERLAMMLEVYEDAEAGMLAGAVESAAGLVRLEPCNDERLLAQRPSPPDLDGASLGTVRRALVRATALADAGRYAEGLQEARTAVVDAEALGWAPLSAEARMVAASVQEELGHYDEVRRELELAFSIAMRAGDDALAARAATKLLRVLGYHLARDEEALAWGTVARALLERTERTDGLDAAALANDTGLTHQSRGDLDEALRWHEQALSLRQRVLGPSHPEAAHSYGNLGNIHAARGEHERALQWHARALEVRQEALGENHPDTARSHNNLGRVHLALGNVEEALHHFRRALEIFEPTGGVSHRLTARILHNLGDAHRARGELPRARDHYRRALGIQRPLLGTEHPETARSAHDLGVVLARQGEPAEALLHLRAALEARTRHLGDDHPDARHTLAAIAALCDDGHAPACDAG